jgi:hypothetical protein
MQRLRRQRIGVWLGVIAVAFYAWLPGHFAGHVVHAVQGALAALDGSPGEHASHRPAHHPAGSNDHRGGTCPICAAAAATAAAATLPVLVALPTPQSMAAPTGVAEARAALLTPSLTPYAPRGPPSAA